jgi:uncharacterized protein (DUF1330 family)
MAMLARTASAAPVYAAIQQGLQARAAATPGEPVPQARIAVHWGHAVERDGDIFGYDVNLTARLVEVAHPGQVVVSDAVKDALAPVLPGVRLRAVGRLVAKGVTSPVRVFEAAASSGRGELAEPVALPEGWVLAVDLFDVGTEDAEELLRFARDAEAAIVGLGGRMLFLGLSCGPGLGEPRLILSVVGFPSHDAFRAYLSDQGLAHLHRLREAVADHELFLDYAPILTMRSLGPFGRAPDITEDDDLPVLPPVPLLDVLRQRRRRRH